MSLFDLLPPHATAENLYIVGSLMVAIMIWVENTMLANNAGKLPRSRLFAIISFWTSAWVVVSAAVLYFLTFDRFAISVPVVYGLYSVMGWIYGARLMKDTGMPDDPRDLVVPVKYLSYAKSFALVFFVFCALILTLSVMGGADKALSLSQMVQ